MIDLRLVAAAAALAVSFGAGWAVNGWRVGAQVDKIKADQSAALATANRSALVLQQRLDAERDGKAAELAAIDAKGAKALRDAQNENDRLQRCIAAGTCGLRVNVVRGACPAGDVPGTAPAGGVDLGAGAELAPAARQDYFTLRGSIERAGAKLTACQASLRLLTGAASTPAAGATRPAQ